MMPRRYANRDPMTPREARQQARILLDAAERGDVDAAHVLLDVLQVSSHDPYIVESLALALRGRSYPSGVELPTFESRARNLKHVLERVRAWVFPPRRSPCMPNRAALRELFEAAQDKAESRSEFAKFWATLQRACNSSSRTTMRNAMEYANDVLDGHGVELLRLRTRRGGTRSALYVNMGDTYNATLVWDRHTDSFKVTTWGDIIESWERRFGQTDEAPDPDEY